MSDEGRQARPDAGQWPPPHGRDGSLPTAQPGSAQYSRYSQPPEDVAALVR